MYQSRLRHRSWLQRMEQKYKLVVETENKKRDIYEESGRKKQIDYKE